jgi:hypothetical protein
VPARPGTLRRATSPARCCATCCRRRRPRHLLRLRALNDYRVDVPWDDAQRNDPIVARLLDGEPMAVRDKGPLFLIYPFDDRPELRSAVYYSRSAWQLRTIEVI